MDVYQLGIFSLAKTMPGSTRVNPYEDQYPTSLGERLQALGWPLDSQPYQLRMLPGLFDPARETFYRAMGIVDKPPPDQDNTLGYAVEHWV